MALPFLPVLKIIALGSLKIIALLFGAVFFPVFSLRFILTGASGTLQPTLDWLESEGRIDSERHLAVIEDLKALAAIEFTRAEARHLLFKLIAKTFQNMVSAIVTLPATLAQLLGRLFKR